MTQDLEQFAEALKSARKKKGFSQEFLAEKTGLHRTYISDLECGRRNPSLTTLLKIAHALTLTVSDLLKGVGDE